MASPDSRKFIHNVLGDTLSIVLAGDRVGQNDLVDEFAHGLLEAPVALVVIRTREARREPGWLRIGYSGKCIRRERCDLRLLALEGANLQARVLWAVEHFLPVQAEERFGGIFSRCLVSPFCERMVEDGLLPIESTSSTAAPPGCKLANLDTSYTRESTIIHWMRRWIN